MYRYRLYLQLADNMEKRRPMYGLPGIFLYCFLSAHIQLHIRKSQHPQAWVSLVRLSFRCRDVRVADILQLEYIVIYMYQLTFFKTWSHRDCYHVATVSRLILIKKNLRRLRSLQLKDLGQS